MPSAQASGTQVPIAPELFTWPSDEPRLIGAKCAQCATVTFPTQQGCPKCGADAMERHLLGRRGRLWTFTTQGFLPKEPYTGPETGEVMVETRLTERDPARLAIGMEMELTVVPFRTDPDGTEVLTYAFAPVTGE